MLSIKMNDFSPSFSSLVNLKTGRVMQGRTEKGKGRHARRGK